MTVPLPTSPPPAALQARALPILLRRLTSTPIDPSLIPLLSSTVRLLASDKLAYGHLSSTSSVPLQIALHLAGTNPSSLPLPLLLDLTTAYPAHRTAVFQLWSHALSASPPAAPPVDGTDSDDEGNTVLGDAIQTQFLPPLISRLQHKPSLADVGVVATLLLALIRAHEELLAMLLIEADHILPALRGAYATISPKPVDGERAPLSKEGARVKEAILLFCVELVHAVQGESVREGLKRLAEVPSGMKRADVRSGFLKGNTMGEDLMLYFASEEGHVGVEVDEDVKVVLSEIRDDEARGDPRVQAILALFPSLPPAQLLSALNHPSYATSSTSSPEEQASPLLDVILSGGSSLPAELIKLKLAVQAMSDQQDSASFTPTPTSAPAPSVPAPKAYVRSNIHDAPLDISRLTLRSGTDEPTPLALAPGVGKEVSDEMRASILRLVERQRVEAAEMARAIAEARGERYRPERFVEDGESENEGEASGGGDDEDEVDEDDVAVGSGVKARGITSLNDGEESGEEENGEVVVQVPKAQKAKPKKDGYDVNIQTKLELAYLADARVFDKDGETRRSVAREKLRKLTGMDDSQLEGWRIMLDRNIHKEAILGRHTFLPARTLDSVLDGRSDAGSSFGGSSRGGRSARGGRRGGGSVGGDTVSVGGESSTSTRGGGGGRGRGENKGNRGHSNAARTRGHDKKMSRMGAGA